MNDLIVGWVAFLRFFLLLLLDDFPWINPLLDGLSYFFQSRGSSNCFCPYGRPIIKICHILDCRCFIIPWIYGLTALRIRACIPWSDSHPGSITEPVRTPTYWMDHAVLFWKRLLLLFSSSCFSTSGLLNIWLYFTWARVSYIYSHVSIEVNGFFHANWNVFVCVSSFHIPFV